MKTAQFYPIVKPAREEEEKIASLIDSITSRITIPKTRIFIGGSFAKGTWLKGLHDIDVYARFSLPYYKGKDISKILREELEKKFKRVKILKGSREYYQLNINNYQVELIPILDIKNPEEAENITDISPLHVEWVRKHKGIEDEIRLSKAFCKSLGVYGAESYIKGFSGYVLEILTIYYKSFYNFIKAASSWKLKIIIDPEKYYKGRNAEREMNSSKTKSPLILIDPVQSTRNAAAGLDEKCYNSFIAAANRFLKKPSKDFFIKKGFDKLSLKNKSKGKSLLIIKAMPKKGREDIIGAKLLKCFNYINMLIEKEGFKVFEKGWSWEKDAYFWFIADKKKLPSVKNHYGPPLKYEQRLQSFKQRWKGTKVYTEKGKSYVKLKRKHRDLKSFVNSLIKTDKYLLGLVSKLKLE